jgi:hypothetical protein
VALSTWEQLYKGVMLRCPMAGQFLAQDWIRWSFRTVVERKKWSWLLKRDQFIIPAQYVTGTVDVVNGSNAVVGHGTTWTASMIGRQFRIGITTPIYTIIAVPSATSLTLSKVWGANTQSGVGYQIYYCYLIPPTDFHSLTVAWDPNFSWKLWTDEVRQEDLAIFDGQRAWQGTPYVLADFDYTNLQLGGAAISPPLPRFEIWPHQTAQYVIPFIYESRPPDLDDAGATLPRYINGDTLMEGALARCAMWPGPSADARNPYFNLTLAKQHEDRFTQQLNDLERQDEEVYSRDVWYDNYWKWPNAPLPFAVSGSFLQLHAI